MSRPVIWIARRLSNATLARAERDYDIIVNHDDIPYNSDDIIAMSSQVDGMIACHSEHFSKAIVDTLDSRLKIVANYSVGTDHCDLPAFAARGIAVTNTPDVLSDATAEISLLLMLGAARRAVPQGVWSFGQGRQGFRGKRVSIDTVFPSGIHLQRIAACSVILPALPWPSWPLPPPSQVSHVSGRLAGDRGIVRGRGKRGVLLFGRLQCTGRASGGLGMGQVRVPAPTLASQGFFSHPSFYVKVGVIVLRLKTHVTFAQHLSLW